ncbi:hypothetical protein [Castellaniella sp.]|nr:hypothetical protein [Castellaniella sp.]
MRAGLKSQGLSAQAQSLDAALDAFDFDRAKNLLDTILNHD